MSRMDWRQAIERWRVPSREELARIRRSRMPPIDVFVIELFPFDDEYQCALIKPLYGTLPVRVVSIPTLIRMKELAGREQDRIDIEHLRMRLDDNGKE